MDNHADISKLTKLVGQSSDPTKTGTMFKPFVVYDRQLDRIVVCTQDCSITERRINGFLTIFCKNHLSVNEDMIVGFSVRPVRRLCKQLKLARTNVYIQDILDAIIFRDTLTTRTLTNLLEKHNIGPVSLVQ